jgi:tetratricopeptide (TPR) repeat protein
MISLFNQKNITEIKASEREYFYTVYRLLKGNASELNTLGYVLLEAGRVDEALLLFDLNARYFRFDPNVYDSYGEALAKVGQTGKAIEMYERVLLLDRSNRTAAEQLARLRNK